MYSLSISLNHPLKSYIKCDTEIATAPGKHHSQLVFMMSAAALIEDVGSVQLAGHIEHLFDFIDDLGVGKGGVEVDK
jgi:hypothetical protein